MNDEDWGYCAGVKIVQSQGLFHRKRFTGTILGHSICYNAARSKQAKEEYRDVVIISRNRFIIIYLGVWRSCRSAAEAL